MYPKIEGYCSEKECDFYDEPQLVSDGAKKTSIEMDISCRDDDCCARLVLCYSYNGIKAWSLREFDAIALGYMKEYELLKRMSAENIANEKDIGRYTKIVSDLKGLQTSCCNNLYIPEHDS